jgi:hypothetical protein
MNRENLVCRAIGTSVLALATLMGTPQVASAAVVPLAPKPVSAPTWAGAAPLSGSAAVALADADCRFPGPCGRVVNNSNEGTRVRWYVDATRNWHVHYLGPRRGIGGYWNDRIDVDDYLVPARCTATVDGTGPGVHPRRAVYSGGRAGTWHKLSSSQTVHIRAIICRGE